MKSVQAYISTILTIVILAGGLLPALHAFDHEISVVDKTGVKENIAKGAIDCELCDFRLTHAEAPLLHSFEFFVPLKETVYSLSLAETVNLFPNRLFSLRAPPVVIS